MPNRPDGDGWVSNRNAVPMQTSIVSIWRQLATIGRNMRRTTLQYPNSCYLLVFRLQTLWCHYPAAIGEPSSLFSASWRIADHWHLQQMSRDVSCSALDVISNEMRYINLRFTYLLAYFHGEIITGQTSGCQQSAAGSSQLSVAGPRVWNTLPEESTSAPSLTIFCQRLKTSLFRQSCPEPESDLSSM